MKITRTTKKCPICGTTFTPKTINSRYCSEQCSRKAYKRKVAEEKRQQELDTIADPFHATDHISQCRKP